MHCKNCHKPLSDEQNFCDDCGAKRIRNRLTPKILAAQINEQFISIDNKFLRTFILKLLQYIEFNIQNLLKITDLTCMNHH